MQSQCPNCHTRYRVSDNKSGKTVKCPKCQHVFKVHSASTKPPDEVCSQCGKEIARDEQAFLFKGSVVCQKCHQSPRTDTTSIKIDEMSKKTASNDSNIVVLKVETWHLICGALLVITGIILVIYLKGFLYKTFSIGLIIGGIYLFRSEECSRMEFDLDKGIYRKWSTFPKRRCLYEGSINEFGYILIKPGLVETDKKKVYNIVYLIDLCYSDDRSPPDLDLRAESFEEAWDKARKLRYQLKLKIPIEIFWSQSDFCAIPPPDSDLFVCPRCFGKPIREIPPEQFMIQYELPGGGAMVRETYEKAGKTWVCDICKGNKFVPREKYLELGI